jgi:hypothetical protein
MKCRFLGRPLKKTKKEVIGTSAFTTSDSVCRFLSNNIHESSNAEITPFGESYSCQSSPGSRSWGRFPICPIINKEKRVAELVTFCTWVTSQDTIQQGRRLCHTIAERFVNPLTSVASLLNFCPKASDKLWAGSVEIKRTLGRTLANWIAREQEVVVFPIRPGTMNKPSC